MIDEQHRFGVEQRAALRAKGEEGEAGTVPDVLVMTATPIPRTAAMTVYGDLDVSTITSKPAGRQEIVTTWANGPLMEEAVWAHVRAEVAGGPPGLRRLPAHRGERQAGGGLGRGDVRAALVVASWPGCGSACSTAGSASAEKEAVMGRFRAGQLDVLVATTVIEVGVDVPNATTMVDPRRRPLRHRPAAPAAGPGGPGQRGVDVLAGDERRGRAVRPRAGAGRHARTASCWPRSTSTCGARARS